MSVRAATRSEHPNRVFPFLRNNHLNILKGFHVSKTVQSERRRKINKIIKLDIITLQNLSQLQKMSTLPLIP